MMNYRETTKHGYKILSLVDTGAMIAEDRPYLLAIAKRETDFKPYIFCDGYDLTNGTWGTGSYYDSFDDASVYLAKRLLDWTATYRDDDNKSTEAFIKEGNEIFKRVGEFVDKYWKNIGIDEDLDALLNNLSDTYDQYTDLRKKVC